MERIEQNKNIQNEIICLWFPYLPVEISFGQHTKFKTSAFAITSEIRNKQVLYSINPFGKLLGLKLGMDLSEAHILCKNLVTEHYCHQKNISFMLNQAKWCNQFTPRISIEKENLLVLNLKGCIHLFGNTENIIKRIHNHFKKINISISLSSGKNMPTVKALAKFNSNEAIRKKSPIMTISHNNMNMNSNSITHNNLNFLKKIPIEALELNNSENEELRYLGIETVHHLKNIPYKDLLTRFGPTLVEKLRKIIGVENELTVYIKLESAFSRSIKLPEPIGLISDIVKLFEKLTRSICKHLKDMNKGTSILNFQLHRVDHTKQLIQIKRSETTSKPENFIMLFKTKINQIKAGFGIDLIRVYADKIENLYPLQDNLKINIIGKDNIINQIVEKEEYKNLISKLSNKIGFDSLIHLHPSQSHIPENISQKVSAVYCPPKSFWPTSLYERPLIMFKPEIIKTLKYKKFPKLFIWRKKQYNINVKFGPERIAAEWWLDNPQWRSGVRDYWKIETKCGTRLWLFESKGAELDGGWYIHGNFV